MKFLTLIVVTLILWFGVFSYGSAATEDTSVPIKLENPLKADNIAELIQGILKFLVAAGAPVATLMIIIGAYQMLFAGGSPEKFETGKKTILYTVIGYVIILLALGLASVIKDILGVSGGP
ncbi:MAG: hypothetical protein UY26_C0001G0014 [Candidatus Jorgensenbacteria bacterium GW2011_GWA1_48_13]|uniref:TrbC/VIRB2 family protein n=2 Tax=Candidatus Joergenseniibacteriota TaxID=1752739 RepID=A0A0G1W9L0_9BACT|nr:MAG: hypothetical protein UY26_C0001G0014 [Candidatus Jorgensenbacteria bacterium GW2011_GWA1_48_13]KKU99375.1 MAG: hypothetical protein UY32_C0001G0010 [Candidatus Jorgensenbacteria bacterium GW2011_GWC1_48_8]KKW15260.1 MAG: hypothetical protein UY55_C0001G0014 [Candidatus Jorgensenbacteria bacterium GW2011_GWB1_50_10]